MYTCVFAVASYPAILSVNIGFSLMFQPSLSRGVNLEPSFFVKSNLKELTFVSPSSCTLLSRVWFMILSETGVVLIVTSSSNKNLFFDERVAVYSLLFMFNVVSALSRVSFSNGKMYVFVALLSVPSILKDLTLTIIFPPPEVIFVPSANGSIFILYENSGLCGLALANFTVASCDLKVGSLPSIVYLMCLVFVFIKLSLSNDISSVW